MADPVISVKTGVDASGLQSGGNDAVNTAKAQLAVLKAEYAKASQAIQQSANGIIAKQKAAADAIAAGFTGNAALLRESAEEQKVTLAGLVNAQGNLKSSMVSLGASIAAASAPARSLSDALQQLQIVERLCAEELAAASPPARSLSDVLQQLQIVESLCASSAEELAAAHGHAVSQVQAAGGAIRTAFGEQSIRSVERFLTLIPGLGAALQLAFPVIGAIALGEQLFRLFEKYDPLIKATKELEAAQKKLDAAFDQAVAHIEHLRVEELALTDGRQRAAKLQSFYDAGAVARDKASLADITLRVEELQKKMRNGDFNSPLPGFLGIFETQRKSTAASQNLNKLLSEQQEIQVRLDEAGVKTEVDTVKAKKDAAEDSRRISDATLQAQMAAVRSLAEDQTKRAEIALNVQKETELSRIDAMENSHARAKAIAAEDVSIAIEREQKLSAIARQEMEQEVSLAESKRKAAGNEVEPAARAAAQIAAEEQIASAKAKFSQQEIQLVGQITEARARLSAVTATQNREADSEQDALYLEAEAKAAEVQASWQNEIDKKLKSELDTIGAQIKLSEQLVTLRQKGAAESSIGGLNQQKAALERDSTLAIGGESNSQKSVRLQKEAEIDAQITAIQINEARVAAEQIAQIYQQNSPQYQEAQNRLTQIQQQADLKRYQDQTKVLAQEHQTYQTFFNQLNQQASRAFNDLLTHPQNFVQDLNGIWIKMVTDFGDKLLLMVLKWAEMEAINIATHGSAVQANNSIDIAARIEQANRDAVTAAQNAYAWASAWGGPIAGAVAAGIAYPAVLALGSFETGTPYVPKTGMYQLHQGERVVTAKDNAGGGYGNQTVNFNGGIHVGGGGANPGHGVVKQIQQAIRRANLRMA